MTRKPLDISLLDDILPFINSSNDGSIQKLIGLAPAQIGALTEYAFFRETSGFVLPSLVEVVGQEVGGFLGEVMSQSWATQHSKTHSLSHRPFEFTRIPTEQESGTDAFWIAFLKRTEGSARAVGLSIPFVTRLMGSFGEIVDNVWQHSQAAATSIVGYQGGDGTFEFVVADAGVGVLRSISTYEGFSAVTDAGTALQAAVTLSSSDFGIRNSRGNGFRRIFANLVNARCLLRFRSDDHGMVMDGVTPDVRSAVTFQTANHRGFLLSLVCDGKA